MLESTPELAGRMYVGLDFSESECTRRRIFGELWFEKEDFFDRVAQTWLSKISHSVAVPNHADSDGVYGKLSQSYANKCKRIQTHTL